MVQPLKKMQREKSQSGSPLGRCWISLLAVAALLLFASMSFATDIPNPPPSVVKIIPASGEVKGWDVVPDTLAYAVGNDLTEIYDGDYELYTKNGVLEAAQQTYKMKNATATVTIHLTESFMAARKFYKYWEVTDKKQSTYKRNTLLSESYTYSDNGVANGYLFRGKFFVTVQVNLDGQQGRAAAFDFLKNISSGYAKKLGTH